MSTTTRSLRLQVDGPAPRIGHHTGMSKQQKQRPRAKLSSEDRAAITRRVCAVLGDLKGKEVAERTGLDINTVSSLRNAIKNRVDPSLQSLYLVARGYGVDVRDLLGPPMEIVAPRGCEHIETRSVPDDVKRRARDAASALGVEELAVGLVDQLVDIAHEAVIADARRQRLKTATTQRDAESGDQAASAANHGPRPR